MKQLLTEYCDGEVDAISVIRRLSGIFNPDHAVTIMTIICAITRVEQGDMTKEMFRKLWLNQ